jgi:hypothetical protein
VAVLALLGVAGMQVWRFTHPPESAATKPSPPAVAPPRAYAVTGTVSRAGKEVPKDVTVVVVQPTWTSEQQQQWEQRVTGMLAEACKELGGGGEAPPTVTADPASVRRADQAMVKRQQAGKASAPWKHRCGTEFLGFLKANSVEAGRATAGADGAFSVTTAPPVGIPYIVHASAGNAQWVDTVGRGSNRLDLNDGNLVSE